MDPGPRPTRPLAALLTAEVISTTGTEMTGIALPWFVLVTTGSPARMGAVLAAEFLGMTVLGVPGGRLATVLGPRGTMLASDLSRASLVFAIPLLHWAGTLSFPLLLAVGFLVGASFPAYSASQRLLLAGLVGDDEVRLTRVSGLIGAVNEAGSFLGPALGGVLVALIGPARVLALDAASYLAAFALVAGLVPRVAGPRPEEERRRALDGVRYVLRERTLLRRVIGLAVVEVAYAALVATLPVAALRRFESRVALAGWFVASFGAGNLVGGLLSSRARRSGDRWARLAVLGIAASTWPLVAPLPAWGVVLAVAANGVSAGLLFPRFFSSLTVRTPPGLRATVMTSVTTAISATAPLGFVGAGLLLHGSQSAAPGFALAAVAATLGAGVFALGGPTATAAERADEPDEGAPSPRT